MTSTIKVDNIQNQSGETFNIVSWDTTAKTSAFTAVSGKGYFVNTTSGAVTVTLPASPSAGDIVAIADYNGTALTNAITIGRNSSDINGSAADLTISANYSAVTLVYVDATSGWRSVDSSNPNDIVTPPEYVAATGGTITTCGDYKIHTFTGPGTFTVCSVGNPLGSTTVDYLVIAGGGGATGRHSGGGGAGGYRESHSTPVSGCYSASPLATATGVTVSAQGYPVVIGAGGSGAPDPGGFPAVSGSTAGESSSALSITSAGGGRGVLYTTAPVNNAGGSGGGGGFPNGAGGSGNTPPVAPPQGSNGGPNAGGAPQYGGGGGGGGAAVGATGSPSSGGNGGAGTTTSISGSPTAYAGGGGGGGYNGVSGTGGTGGGGAAGNPATAGSNNTGGGGGSGSGIGVAGANGGSGIVIIRYKFQ